MKEEWIQKIAEGDRDTSVSYTHLGEIEIPVKMLVTRARTERPHGALLQLDTGIRYCMYRIGGRLRNLDASLR